MKKVVCVGSATMDILVKSRDFKVTKSHLVKGGLALAEVYGGKTDAEVMEFSGGGSATNVAVGLARLGFITASLSRVGNDFLKEIIFNELKIEGVETSLIQVDEKVRTALSVVLIAPDGGRSIITYRGAAKEIDSEKIDWDKVATADWLQVGAVGGKMELVEDLIRFAKNKGIGVSWNPGKGELFEKEKIFRLLPKVDLFVLNRMEAAQLLSHNYEEMKEMARKILSHGVRRVSVTDGRRGAGIAQGNAYIFAPAFKTETVDETGAGDAFVAGVVGGILSDKPLETSLLMGLANGASQVTLIGAKSGLLRKEEMKKWLRRRVKMTEEKLRSDT